VEKTLHCSLVEQWRTKTRKKNKKKNEEEEEREG
jgi:hypothetical protein